jgi:N-acetylglucosaminyl-diphospho-decaprenol L-rhamnosyltransferase
VTSSVVVVSLRAGDWLGPCLESVRHQADQLVVVDNGSPGAEVSEVARGFGATVVHNRVNQGFTGGANQGIRRATGEVVALLNDDAVADPTWISTAASVLDDPTVAAVTPKVLLDGWFAQVAPTGEAWYAPPDPRPLGEKLRSVRCGGAEVLAQVVGPGVYPLESGTEDGASVSWRWTRPGRPYYVPLPAGARDGDIVVNGTDPVAVDAVCRLVNNAGLYLRSDGYSGDYGLETPDDGRFDAPRYPFGVSGTALVARAEVFRSVGLLAEPFFAYYEDTDWSWRARRFGLRLAYDPSTSISHRRSVTSATTLGSRVRILGERNRLLSIIRNAPRPVVTREVRRRMVDGPDHGVRRGMLRHLPWALATRAQLNRRSEVNPRQLWDEWAGTDVTWDDGPADPTWAEEVEGG